jgi:hypothetical protein
MNPDGSPLAVLSLIVAPAVLTNASSVLALGTTNRMARAVDRARELARELDDETDPRQARSARRLAELAAAEQRAVMLVQALRSFYVALGGFASAALFALLGATLATVHSAWIVTTTQFIGLAAGLGALAALIHGSVTLVRETRIALVVLRERAAGIRVRMGVEQPTRDDASS